MGEFSYHNDEGSFAASYRMALSHHMPDSHFHHTYELYYLMSGEREFFINDRTLVIGEGDIVIIAPHVLHRTTNAVRPKHERLIINMHEQRIRMADTVSPSVLQPLKEHEYLIFKTTPQLRALVDPLARAMIHELREAEPGFELYAQALAVQLIVLCCRHVRQHSPEPAAYPTPMHERVSEIVRYMNIHYMNPLSLQLLADRFYISPYYLSRSFKQATGFTFVEYLNSLRVKEAMKLLVNSSMKVNDISRKVGFGSVTHFGRVFRMITGHPPLFYRRSMK